MLPTTFPVISKSRLKILVWHCITWTRIGEATFRFANLVLQARGRVKEFAVVIW